MLTFRNFIFREYSVYRTLGFTKSAIDTFIWMNNEKVGAFIKTIYRTNLYAIGEFALIQLCPMTNVIKFFLIMGRK